MMHTHSICGSESLRESVATGIEGWQFSWKTEAELFQQKWEEARKLLAPLLQAAPKNVDVLTGLARCAEQRKDCRLSLEKLIVLRLMSADPNCSAEVIGEGYQYAMRNRLVTRRTIAFR